MDEMTRREAVSTDGAPAAIGPYSQAMRAGGLLFISGQLGMDPSTKQLVGDSVEAQAKQVMENLKAILQSQNLDFGRVVKMNIFLEDMADFKTVNSVYQNYVTEPYPARACVAVKELPLKGKVEIEAIACYA